MSIASESVESLFTDSGESDDDVDYLSLIEDYAARFDDPSRIIMVGLCDTLKRGTHVEVRTQFTLRQHAYLSCFPANFHASRARGAWACVAVRGINKSI